jgi:IS30 family transposase
VNSSWAPRGPRNLSQPSRNSLFIQTRGVLKKELTTQLRTARRTRHPKSHNAKSGRGQILDTVSIRERAAEIEDRAVPGHWEGDLLTGANDTHIATLCETDCVSRMFFDKFARRAAGSMAPEAALRPRRPASACGYRSRQN